MDPGTVIDSKYQIVRQLGQGGMGAVYEAEHLGTGRKVALKVIVKEALQSGGDVVARFQREARASGAIDSQHVVQVLDTGVDPATQSPYLVMEHLTGEDLRALLDRVGPLPPDLALRIIAQACVGLARAHALGIVHRDIKAANIFVARREGDELTVKVLDFGIAKVRSSVLDMSGASMTKTGTMLGSPVYMAPEQVVGNKDLDARADLFSLGITLYEALTGTTPNAEAETMGALLIAICAGRGQPLAQRMPATPPAVIAIFEKATTIEPSARFASADEMRAAILSLLPQGAALTASMLPTDRAPAAMSSDRLPFSTPSDVRVAAARFLPESTRERRTRSAWRIVAPVGLFFAVIGLALGAFALTQPRAAIPPSIDAEAATVVTATTVASAASAAVPLPEPPASSSAPPPEPPPSAKRPNPVGIRPVPPKNECNPNYYFDKDGVKHFKEQCF